MIVIELGEFFLKTFSLSDSDDKVSGFLVFVGETLDQVPMVENVLRESFSLGKTSKETGEAERFSDGEISFDLG